MSEYNDCPKEERCIYGETCERNGCFKGEYLCFESIEYDYVNHETRSDKKIRAEKGRK